MARKMKDSGIEWIGEIPEDWEIRRTKTLYTSYKDIVGDKANYYERLALTLKGVIRRDKEDNTGLQPKGFNGYQVLRKGELVFKLIDLENISTSRVGLSPFTGIVSPAYIILTPKNEILAKFGLYFFFSLWQRAIFNRMGDDGVRSSLNLGDLMNTPHCCTDLSEQQRIADFLDTKCAQIEEILQKTRDTIAEYKKLKQSVITQAVTKGVRGERPMKDSGIEWIGEIPEEWEIKKLKYCAIFAPNCNTDKFNVDTEVTFSPMECIHNGYFENKKSKFSLLNSSYTQYQNGDIVLAKVTPCFENGNIAVMDNLFSGFGFGSSELFVIRSFNVYTRYLFYYLQNEIFKILACSTMTGTGGLKRVSPMFVRNYFVLLPEKKEQQEIAAYLDQKCTEIDKLIEKKEQLVGELENYKKSLIYEYVTGKKEVSF